MVSRTPAKTLDPLPQFKATAKSGGVMPNRQHKIETTCWSSPTRWKLCNTSDSAINGNVLWFWRSICLNSAGSALSHKRFFSGLLAALLATFVSFANAQEDSCPAIGEPATEISFTLIGDHIYTEAHVNGTGPYRFIVDTGGVNLVDVGLAKQLSLRITGSETGHGTGQEAVESGKTTVEHLTLGKV